MNAALLALFDPLEWHCSGCGADSGVPCPTQQYAGFIQLTCPDRVRTAQHYGMQYWRSQQTSRHAYPSIQTQPHGAA